jgi:hypothetical protein
MTLMSRAPPDRQQALNLGLRSLRDVLIGQRRGRDRFVMEGQVQTSQDILQPGDPT